MVNKYLLLLQSINQGFCIIEMIWNENGEAIDYRFLEINKAFEKQTGIKDAVGKTMREIEPKHEEHWFRIYGEVVKSGKAIHFEQQAEPLIEGWYEVDAFPMEDNKVAVLFNDISERKRAEKLAKEFTAQLEQQVKERTQELEESRKLLQSVFDVSIDRIVVKKSIRNARGKIIDFEIVAVNKKAKLYSGENDFPGKKRSALFPGPISPEYHQKLIEAVETGITQDFELHYIHNKIDSWYRVKVARLGDGVVVSTEDITKRKKAEETIQQMLNGSAAGIIIHDSVRDEQGRIVDFIITGANQMAEEILHKNRESLLGNRVFKLFPNLKPVFFEQYVNVVETGNSLRLEYPVLIEEESRWFNFTVVKNGDGFINSFYDITERIKGEKEKYKNLTLLQQSEEVAQMGSWEYDFATNSVHWSEGLYKLFGLPPGSEVGPETYLDFVVPEDLGIAQHIVAALQENQDFFEEAMRIQVDGEIKTLKIKAILLRNAAGVPEKLLGINLDVSDVKRLEQENLQIRLEKQKALLLAILDAQEEERRRISESLHNGIAQILYATKLNLQHVAKQLPPGSIKYAEELLGEAINETRRVSHELVPVILHDFGLEEGIYDLCSKYRNSSLLLRCSVEGIQGRLVSYLEVALYRIIQELINNIVKHAHASEANLLLQKLEDKIILQVQDNGRGMPPDADKKKGIGLHTISDRVKLLNGTFTISKPITSNGTFVTIQIPL